MCHRDRVRGWRRRKWGFLIGPTPVHLPAWRAAVLESMGSTVHRDPPDPPDPPEPVPRPPPPRRPQEAVHAAAFSLQSGRRKLIMHEIVPGLYQFVVI